MHCLETLAYTWSVNATVKIDDCKSVLTMLYCLSHLQVTIVETGKFNRLGIGLVNQDYEFTWMPGWGIESVGYHTDDGNVFHSSFRGIQTKGMETCLQDKTFETTVVDAYSAGQVRDRGGGGEGGDVGAGEEVLIIEPLTLIFLGRLKKYINISFGSFYFTRFINRLTTYKLSHLQARY